MADDTRLRMLALLLEQPELCVCHFEQILEITQSKASRHLHYLLNAGLVDDRREGIWIHYRLADGMDAGRRAILDAVCSAMSKTTLDGLRRQLAALPEVVAAAQSGCRVSSPANSA